MHARTPHASQGLRSRAASRALVLRSRLNIMTAITAITSHEVANLRYTAALAERRGRDIATREAQESATRSLQAAQAAHRLACAASPAYVLTERAEIAKSDLARFELQVDEAISNRISELEAINDRIADLARDRIVSATGVADAVRAIGLYSADLGDLVSRAGVPGALEILACPSVVTRHARAIALLEAMTAESRRADEELGRVASSESYDRALMEVIDAEHAHELARVDVAHASRRNDDALASLMAANRRLEEAARALPPPAEDLSQTPGPSRMGNGSPAAASAKGSVPADSDSGVPEAIARVGESDLRRGSGSEAASGSSSGLEALQAETVFGEADSPSGSGRHPAGLRLELAPNEAARLDYDEAARRAECA